MAKKTKTCNLCRGPQRPDGTYHHHQLCALLSGVLTPAPSEDEPAPPLSRAARKVFKNVKSGGMVSTDPGKDLVERYQCPGCMRGSDTTCGKFIQRPGSLDCHSHVPGTRYNGQLIALGLPKGFNRLGDHMTKIRIITSLMMYNHLNVAVWAMKHEGNVLVRCFMPRINQTTIDIVAGATELPAGSIDVSKFTEDID